MTAPSGGFGAVGTSTGSGVSPFTSHRARIAGAGSNSLTSVRCAPVPSWRSGVMLSRIQSERP